MKITRKEFNKLIERTSKRDANLAVVGWAKGTAKEQDYGSASWYAKQKGESHKEFLETLPYYYDYAHSVPRLKADDSEIEVS